jgi:hypothetical protein
MEAKVLLYILRILNVQFPEGFDRIRTKRGASFYTFETFLYGKKAEEEDMEGIGNQAPVFFYRDYFEKIMSAYTNLLKNYAEEILKQDPEINKMDAYAKDWFRRNEKTNGR